MKTLIFDSWPIVEWILDKEPVSSLVDTMLIEAEAGRLVLRMSAINVGEVFYFVRKQFSESLAEEWRTSSATLPIKIEVPTAGEIWDAANLKSKWPISYADAFAAALAMKYHCPVVTGDPEFRKVKDLQIEWVGPN